MTFMGRNGRQEVVIAAGGDGLLGVAARIEEMAFGLQ